MAYYKKIKGKNYDKKLIDLADSFTSNKADGRISLEDAKILLEAVKDSNSYTDVEKATISYIRQNYKFTEPADKWFRTEIRKWAATKSKLTEKNIKKIPKTQEKKDSEKNTNTQDEEVIPLVEEIEGTEKIIPPPTIPKIDTKLINEELPNKREKQNKQNLKLLFIFLIILAVVIFLIFWQPKCSGQENLSENPNKLEKHQEVQVPIQQKEETSKKSSFTKEDLLKTKFEFKKGTVDLTPESLETIKKISELLKTDTNLKIKIIGHSCDLGSESFNNKISLKRAETVRNLLVSENIPPERILIEGKGNREPILPNDTEENRSKNRRVEFQLVE